MKRAMASCSTSRSTRALLNSELTTEAARAFATRVEREAGEDASQRVKLAFQLALQRMPAVDHVLERRSILAFETLDQGEPSGRHALGGTRGRRELLWQRGVDHEI